ncbi:MAG: response regulator transcription factor [Thermomicrobiales bacterium]|nr:response regulator transcription factor [Thermomicrobiales bacterium]MCO5219289.1 response regulator transcription factor [Thermomicrobiales bacterium]MCO5226299.1 response regulator transcription factor [Thermomicrobiales bacterium]MCO5226866.1 response regulator transcription factor [Thermomicrobiales bacterium]
MVDKVLVVDDEDNISFLVASALRREGMEVKTAATGRDALDQAIGWRPDAIVLDVMLPDLDGFSVMRRLRDGGYTVPVVFLTARDRLEDRLQGLSDGGDDYLVKPFDVAELVARVRLRLRNPLDQTARNHLRCADLEMDLRLHEVVRAGQIVSLSAKEYQLLHYLLINTGHILTRAQILDYVWGYEFEGEPAIVDTYISYLRRKIDTVEPRLIQTVRGVGFCLRVEP